MLSLGVPLDAVDLVEFDSPYLAVRKNNAVCVVAPTRHCDNPDNDVIEAGKTIYSNRDRSTYMKFTDLISLQAILEDEDNGEA